MFSRVDYRAHLAVEVTAPLKTEVTRSLALTSFATCEPSPTDETFLFLFPPNLRQYKPTSSYSVRILMSPLMSKNIAQRLHVRSLCVEESCSLAVSNRKRKAQKGIVIASDSFPFLIFSVYALTWRTTSASPVPPNALRIKFVTRCI